VVEEQACQCRDNIVDVMDNNISCHLGVQAGNVTGPVYPDVLLKEKEKLGKELEKGKAAYESEVVI